jgi:hypothetical protein
MGVSKDWKKRFHFFQCLDKGSFSDLFSAVRIQRKKALLSGFQMKLKRQDLVFVNKRLISTGFA